MANANWRPSGRVDWNLSPFYFRQPGTEYTSYAVALEESSEHLCFRINSRLAIEILLEQEAKAPGSLKKGLCWIAPFSSPPCWHQLADVKMKEVHLGIEVTLYLKPCPFQEEEGEDDEKNY